MVLTVGASVWVASVDLLGVNLPAPRELAAADLRRAGGEDSRRVAAAAVVFSFFTAVFEVSAARPREASGEHALADAGARPPAAAGALGEASRPAGLANVSGRATSLWAVAVSASEQEKRAAARAAAQLVSDGQMVGLGTGSTVAHLLPALAARSLAIRCVATSPHTAEVARSLGLDVVSFSGIERLDIAIDGADQVDDDGWLIKGGGGAHTREKVVAAAAERFVVIVSSDKVVPRIGPPVPLELLRFGLEATFRELGAVRVRDASPPSPDGGLIADWLEPFDDRAAARARLDACPGVLGHGIFAPALVSDVLIASGEAVEHRVLG